MEVFLPLHEVKALLSINTRSRSIDSTQYQLNMSVLENHLNRMM